MDLQLTDKVVIVTGAAGGIGLATAQLFAEEGAIVIGVDRDPITNAPGSNGSSIRADLTDPDAAQSIADTALERYGKIDGLVNNAGGLNLRTTFTGVTDADWDWTLALNFHAARRLSKAVIPSMLANGGGSLVHVGSDSARLPSQFNLDYSAAKLALLSLNKALAAEFTPQGIRSNVVAPGMTRTPLYEREGGFGDQVAQALGTDRATAIDQMLHGIRPLLTGKMGEPSDVARVIVFLTSPLNSQVTGAEWTVDGGVLPQV